MTIIGFTGSQSGMTREQREAITVILDKIEPLEVHHGDCVGADAQFHEIAVKKGLRIIIHPAHMVGGKRAYCSGAYHTHEPIPPLERNRVIVGTSDLMLATPRERMEILRSGTWATIRYAKGRSKGLYVVFPDGSYELYSWY